MALLAKLRARVEQLLAKPPTAAQRAAVRIQAKLRADATTRRGNVPQFAPGAKGHPGETIPIVATAEGSSVSVSAPDWVLRKAAEKGQHASWGEIVREELRRD